MAKNVHTEHCCIVHGCKYGDDNCAVTTKEHPQSYKCDQCKAEDIDPTQANPETNIYGLKEFGYYKTTPGMDIVESLMYVMGRLKDNSGKDTLICDLWLWSLPACRYVSSVQGTSKIMLSQWTEVTKGEYDALKASLEVSTI